MYVFWCSCEEYVVIVYCLDNYPPKCTLLPKQQKSSSANTADWQFVFVVEKFLVCLPKQLSFKNISDGGLHA